MKQPAVYLLSSQPNGTLYVGVTSNLIQRIWQHREGMVEGFTRKYGVKTLVWYEQHETMQSAIGREKALKKWNRDWKLRLVETRNPHWLDLWPEIIGQEPHVLNDVSFPDVVNQWPLSSESDQPSWHASSNPPLSNELNKPSLPSELNKPPLPNELSKPSFPSAFIGNPAAPLDSRLRGNDDGEGGEQ